MVSACVSNKYVVACDIQRVAAEALDLELQWSVIL